MIKVMLEDCDQRVDKVCYIDLYHLIIGQVYFTSTSKSANLHFKLYQDDPLHLIPLPSTFQDGCLNLEEGSCPVKEGDNIVYGIKLPVGLNFPQVRQP